MKKWVLCLAIAGLFVQPLSLFATPCAWQVNTTWGTPNAGTFMYETDSHWYYGFYEKRRAPMTFDGSAALTNHVSVRPEWSYYDVQTDPVSSVHTWKKMTLTNSGNCPSPANVTYKVSGYCTVAGSELVADNDSWLTDGMASVYVYAEGLCGGLASDGVKPAGKVEGKVSLTEGDDVNIAVGVNINIPLWGETWAVVGGNDAILSTDSVDDAGAHDFISFDAYANSLAASKDGAFTANAHGLTVLEEMTLTVH